MGLHGALAWLETNVRKPLEGSLVDDMFMAPLKRMYVGFRHQA